jgi:hypothetical protein
VREVRQEEVEWIQGIAAGYVQRARQYRRELASQDVPSGER